MLMSKIALITGAGQGIGAAIAKYLGAAGCKLVLELFLCNKQRL